MQGNLRPSCRSQVSLFTFFSPFLKKGVSLFSLFLSHEGLAFRSFFRMGERRKCGGKDEPKHEKKIEDLNLHELVQEDDHCTSAPGGGKGVDW